jgi:hypothetical protein
MDDARPAELGARTSLGEDDDDDDDDDESWQANGNRFYPRVFVFAWLSDTRGGRMN